jgi:hypothetical protein
MDGALALTTGQIVCSQLGSIKTQVWLAHTPQTAMHAGAPLTTSPNNGSAPVDPMAPVPTATSGACANPTFAVEAKMLPSGYKFCVDLTLTYDGPGACNKFRFTATMDPSLVNISHGFSSTRAPVNGVDQATGQVDIVSPVWYDRVKKGQKAGAPFKTKVCGRYAVGVKGEEVDAVQLQSSILSMATVCLICS